MFVGFGFVGTIEMIILAIGAWFLYQQLRGIWDNSPELSQNKKLRDVPFFVAGAALLLSTSPQWVWMLPWQGVRVAIFGLWGYLVLNGLWHIRKFFRDKNGDK